VLLKGSHDNPSESFGFIPTASGGAFDRHDAFCHIIALRFHRVMAAQASVSGAKSGQPVGQHGLAPKAARRGFEPQTSPSRHLSRFFGDQLMGKALLKDAPSCPHGGTGTEKIASRFTHHN